MPELSKKVRFIKVSAKSLMQQVAGAEPPYPVYRFSGRTKFERPGVPGNEYRWINS